MKTKAAMIIAIASVTVSFAAYSHSQGSNNSDLILANIDALAQGESGGNYDCVAPFTIKCSQEGSVRVPGYKMDK